MHRSAAACSGDASPDRASGDLREWALDGPVIRRAVVSALREELRGADRQILAVVICDLDRFHRVNGALGYAAGDELLQVVARRLDDAAGPQGRLVQVDGDRFLLVFSRLSGPADLDGAPDRLRQAVVPPVRPDGRLLYVHATFGTAWRLVDGSDVEGAGAELLRLAEADLHRGKERRQARTPVDTRYDLLQLDTDLHVAIDSGALVAHFQPLYDLGSSRVHGFEALARWPHPSLGFVPPDVFIPVAEDNGLIHAVGEHVLRAAHRFLLADRGAGHRMYVNVSTDQLAAPGFADLVTRVFEDDRALLGRLTVEVTESSLILDLPGVAAELAALRTLGVGIAVDDFGSGYSSLSQLQELPVTELKIDRGLVQRDGAVGHAVLRSVMHLAHGLGLWVVAEGVERPEQLELLRQLGCDRAQGFLFAPALPEDLALALLDMPLTA